MENKKMIRLYLAFLPETETEPDRLKLCQEITRLQHQNNDIDAMTVADYKRGVATRNKTKHSVQYE